MKIRAFTLAGLTLLTLAVGAAPALASAALITKPVHVLAGPGPTFASLLELTTNNKVGVLWCGPQDFDWCLIQYHRKAGWIHMADLTILDANGVPLDEPNKSSLADPGGPPTHEPHELVSRIDEPTHITLTTTTIHQVKVP
jgi:hypothetical protein